MRLLLLYILASLATVLLACDSCSGPITDVVHERKVRRMQPGAQNATGLPKGPLEWGQLNFLHTTDTHGWLEGHIKEQNYGADWGDFVSFTKHMRRKAKDLDVDLIIVDTGDLHDGNGLSDATEPNGVLSNPIHDKIDYDILAIGNHELYVTEVAYETFANYSKYWGDKYLTSNVEIYNPATQAFEYMGQKFRHFKTKHGLHIMAFGVLFDFTGNSNVSRVTKAADMIEQDWFFHAVFCECRIDMFLVIGHNPIRTDQDDFTLELVANYLRLHRPGIPVQVFGGHTHIRDFRVYDHMSTALESGRYCETVGWLSMSGFSPFDYHGSPNPIGVPNPTRPATPDSTSGFVYSRRYLDWNRVTFEYHAVGSQFDTKFDLHSGLAVSNEIAEIRKELNLPLLYGCAPATYCITCLPYDDPGNIFTLVRTALGAIVVNASRSTIPRYIIVNTGNIRFDLVKGPFTLDDSFIVSPFINIFRYIPSVPYTIAKQVLAKMNNAQLPDKRASSPSNFGSMALLNTPEQCRNPPIPSLDERDLHSGSKSSGRVTRRQVVVKPGYVTTDDWGTDGDDTPHSPIPEYKLPHYVAGNGSFPTDGTTPKVVDIVFLDYFGKLVIQALNDLGGKYSTSDIQNYLDPSYTTRDYLLDYAKKFWQKNMPNCPVGQGVGYPDR